MSQVIALDKKTINEKNAVCACAGQGVPVSIPTAFCFEISEISKDGSWGVDTEVRTFAIICNTTVHNVYCSQGMIDQHHVQTMFRCQTLR